MARSIEGSPIAGRDTPKGALKIGAQLLGAAGKTAVMVSSLLGGAVGCNSSEEFKPLPAATTESAEKVSEGQAVFKVKIEPDTTFTGLDLERISFTLTHAAFDGEFRLKITAGEPGQSGERIVFDTGVNKSTTGGSAWKADGVIGKKDRLVAEVTFVDREGDISTNAQEVPHGTGDTRFNMTFNSRGSN